MFWNHSNNIIWPTLEIVHLHNLVISCCKIHGIFVLCCFLLVAWPYNCGYSFCSLLGYHRIVQYFGLEGTLKTIWFQAACHRTMCSKPHPWTLPSSSPVSYWRILPICHGKLKIWNSLHCLSISVNNFSEVSNEHLGWQWLLTNLLIYLLICKELC